MKSGLRDRNNDCYRSIKETLEACAAMKSGLRDRNNSNVKIPDHAVAWMAAMKSGLRDRNNYRSAMVAGLAQTSCNEVRS